jgi:hypothetical protein
MNKKGLSVLFVWFIGTINMVQSLLGGGGIVLSLLSKHHCQP